MEDTHPIVTKLEELLNVKFKQQDDITVAFEEAFEAEEKHLKDLFFKTVKKLQKLAKEETPEKRAASDIYWEIILDLLEVTSTEEGQAVIIWFAYRNSDVIKTKGNTWNTPDGDSLEIETIEDLYEYIKTIFA